MRGRKKLDLAYRARTWFWYALVKDKLQLSDDKLDELYAKANEFQRSRVFWNYRRVGFSPDARKASRSRGKSVFERVHEAHPVSLQVAKHLFESPFWELLAQPARMNAEYSAAIAKTVRDRGWYRVDAERYHDVWNILGADEPALEQHAADGYLKMVRFLVESQPDIDALYLLALLFREAHGALAAEHAEIAKSGLLAAVDFFWRCLPVDRNLGLLLGRLVSDRIIYNSIIDEDNFAGPLNASSGALKSRFGRLKAFIDAYVADRGFSGPNLVRCPIVSFDERIQWFEDHREHLSGMAREAASAEAQASNLSDYEHPEAVRQCDDYKIKAAVLRSAINPPERDSKNHLPASAQDASDRVGSDISSMSFRVPSSLRDPS